MKANHTYEAVDIERMARQRAERIQRKIEYSVDTAPRTADIQRAQGAGRGAGRSPSKDLSNEFLDCLWSDLKPGFGEGEQTRKCSTSGTALKKFPLNEQEPSKDDPKVERVGSGEKQKIDLTLNHSVFGNIVLSGYHTPGVGIKLRVNLAHGLKPAQIEKLERFMSGQLSSQVGVNVEVKIG